MTVTLDPSLPIGSPRLGRVTVIAIAALTVMGTVGSAFSPWLLVRHPLWLVALSPDVRHIVLVAAHSPFAPVLAVGVVRRAAGLVAMYGLGRYYGPTVLRGFEQRAPRLARTIRWLERWFARIGAPLLVLFPSYTLGALAGAARTRVPVFVPAMLLGQVAYVTASYYFGDAVRVWTLPLLAFLQRHVVASTAVVAALVLGQQVWSRTRKGPAPL